MRYLSFMDGLRAIAVVAVLLYHLDSQLVPNGFLGVDVFFVISGFIVSHAVAGRGISRAGTFLLDFYARRFLRIVPALVVCLLGTTLAAILFTPDAWVSNAQYRTARAAFWGVSNIQLARGTDYFSPISEFNPFTQTWSLGVEEQFYLLFPLLFLPWLMSAAARRLSLAICLGAAAVSLVLWLLLRGNQPLQAFYMIHARFWELALGVACFQITTLLRERGMVFRPDLPASLALLALAGSMFVALPGAQSWLVNVAAVVATVLLIAALQQPGQGGLIGRCVSLAPLRAIGLISYSLYLWHWPVFVLARWTSGLETLSQKLAAAALAVLLALISYRVVEMPVRRSTTLQGMSRSRVVALGLATLLAGWGVFDFAVANRASVALSTVMRNRNLWMADMPHRSFPDIPGCTVVQRREGLAARFSRTGCGEASVGTVFFMGDSHAAAYIQLLTRFTLLSGVDSVLVTTAGCPVLSLQQDRDSAPACAAATAAALSFVQGRAQKGDVLFLPSLRLPRFADQFVRFPDSEVIEAAMGSTAATKRSHAVTAAIAVLTPFSIAGVSVLFEAPKPIFKASGFRCSDWFNRTNPACTDGLTIERALIGDMRRPVLDAFAEISRKVPGVHVWDPLPVLCPTDRCEAVPNGQPLFFDGDHVSGLANVLLTPSFTKAVSEVLGGTNGGR